MGSCWRTSVRLYSRLFSLSLSLSLSLLFLKESESLNGRGEREMASPLSPVKTAVEKISEEEEAQLDLGLGGGEEEEEEDQDQDVRKAEEADTGTPKLAPLTRDELRQGLDRMAQQQ